MRGVTLIEVLITTFIVSIAVLGVAGLQATSLRAGADATKRSLAIFYSASIADQMRANRSALATYGVGEEGSGTDYGCASTTTTSPVAHQCTDVQMAQQDIFYWKAAIASEFVNLGPKASITVDTTEVPATVRVTISWRERDKYTQDSEGNPMDMKRGTHTIELKI